MLNGDPEPFAALYSHADDIFYMGAEGTYRRGWEAAYADWKAQAAKGTGGKVEGGDIHIVVDGDTAIAAHWTVGTVKQADGKIAEVNARETSIFRKEQGEWRMIGHHADVVPPWAKKFD
jgi:uncharacterized protein (TIGR02246 family)